MTDAALFPDVIPNWVQGRWPQLTAGGKRYGLCVLNSTATSNHSHLLALDQGHGEIASSMQPIAGCTGQESDPVSTPHTVCHQ